MFEELLCQTLVALGLSLHQILGCGETGFEDDLLDQIPVGEILVGREQIPDFVGKFVHDLFLGFGERPVLGGILVVEMAGFVENLDWESVVPVEIFDFVERSEEIHLGNHQIVF